MKKNGILGRTTHLAPSIGHTWLVVCLGLALVCLAANSYGQVASGITGTVTDQNGAVVVAAQVDLTDTATGVVQHTVTSGAGTYSFTGLIPGPYTIAVEAKGFKKTLKSGVLVENANVETIDVALSAGAASEVVEVTADSISLNTTQPQLGTTIEPEFLNALPTVVAGRGRQIDSFQYLVPGVQGGSFTHEVSGGVWFQQEVVINGIPMPQSETEGFTTYINPPWELIQEFRVERTTFAAQYGLAQGAVSYQTASGTNKLHGDGFEINRNSSFDSKGFFNNTVPYDRENNYGFSVGGPVWLPKVYKGQNRTFFHLSVEWFRQNATVTGGNDTVPTQQERTGDFSDFVNGATGALIPIYDPTTNQQFQYNGKMNVIPPGRISANSQSLLTYLPLPNIPGSNIGGLDQNRAYDPYPNPTLNSNWGFTLDHNLSSTQSIHWTEWRDKLTTNQVFVLGPLVAPPNPLNAVAQELQLGTGFILGYTNTFTPHLVMTATAGWLGEINNESPLTTVSLPQVQDGQVMPQISFDGLHAPTQWGTSGSLLNSVNRKAAFDIENNWLWTRNKHTFNIGVEVRRTYQDAFQSGSGGGHISFSHDETSLPDPSDPNFSTDGSSFASFLLGLPDSANRAFTEQDKLRNFDVSPYIQDDIKLNPKLTVNAGVRWDIAVPFIAKGNDIAFLDPRESNSYAGGLLGTATTLGDCATCVGWNRADIQWGHFGPRVGFAYMLSNKMVLQAGYSLVYIKGGAYSYGDNLVADEYSTLLGGAYTRSSSGTNQSSYGSWDTNPLPAPASGGIGPKSGIANDIPLLQKTDGYLPYSQQWNVNLQRQLPFNTFMTLAYVGSRQTHILSNLNHPDEYPDSALQLGSKLNDNFATGTAQADGFALPYPNFVADFGPNATVYQSLKPFPQYADVQNWMEGSGSVFYQGLQAQVEKRYTNGLAFLYALTLARTDSNTDGGNAGFAGSAMDKYRQSQEYGVSGADQKYNNKLSFTYSLPIGKGQRWLNSNPIVRDIVGGIQVSGILDYEGGSPYSAGASGYSFQPAGFNRPNRVSSVKLGSAGRGAVKQWILSGHTGLGPQMFDPAAFVDTGSPYVLGDAAREYSSLRGTPIHNENLSAKKAFYAGGLKFILQADFFNAFNRSVFNSNPDTNVDDTGSFGHMTYASTSSSNRQGQGTLRIEF